jgi:hypothetical protein
VTVRHITQADNVDPDGLMIDPSLVHHGTVRASHVASLAGPIDPTTHLNRDFAGHDLGECVIAVRLEVDAELVLDENGQFARCRARHDASQRLGPVDEGARRQEWLAVLRERRG